MSAGKPKAPQTAVETETSASDTGMSVMPWVESTASARDRVIECSRDLAEIARTASDAMIDGLAEYGGEICDINSIWSSAMVSSLEDTGRLLTGDTSVSATTLGETGSAMMTKVQRLLEANQRLAERQFGAASAACQALSALPSRIFGSMGDA